MKRATYMSSNELLDWLKIGCFAGEADAIAKRTPEADWRKKLKTIATMAANITNERLAAIEPKQQRTVERRSKHTSLMLLSVDQQRTERHVETEVHISIDDLYDLLDAMCLSCRLCPQGESVVKACTRRDLMHRVGVEAFREPQNVGECEFRHDNDIVAVSPAYRKIDNVRMLGDIRK